MSCHNCGKNKCFCEKVVSKEGRTGKNGRPGRTGAQGPPGPTGPAGPSNLAVNNTVFVMKNGNDSTGLVQRLDKPFLTIAAARTAALAAFTSRTEINRIRIVVETGYYEENIILDKFIDYDLNNSVINGGVTDNQVDFGAVLNGAWTNIIYGQAKFRKVATDIGAVLIFKKGTRLLLNCDTISSVADDCIAVLDGYVRIHANKIFCEATTANHQFTIEMAQGFITTTYTESIVEIIGADIYNAAGSQASVIGFSSGAASKNQTLSLINCRVKALNDTESDGGCSCVSVGFVQPSNGRLNLYNTVLYSTAGNSIFVNTGQTLTARFYHSNMSNVAAGGGGTLTSLVNSITVDTDVQAGF